MRIKIIAGILVALFLLGFGRLYIEDSATVEQALLLEKFFKTYCQQHKSYPDFEIVANNFPELYPNREWYYWPNESRTIATFQYPMTLPIPFAPGRSKLSEFIPVIYAYAVHNPCHEIL